MTNRLLSAPVLAGLSLFIGIVVCGLVGGGSGSAVAAPVVCPGGHFTVEDYVTREGRTGQSLFCVFANGDRVDVSIPATVLSGLFYSLLLFPVLWVGARYYQARRARSGPIRAAAVPVPPAPSSTAPGPGAPASSAPPGPSLAALPAAPAGGAGKRTLAQATAELNQLKDLRDSGAISAEDFDARRAEILDDL